MKSEATTVEGYLAEAPAERRPALETLRGLCLEELAGYHEGMDYGMPSYSRDGAAVEVAFASQKNHVSLYIMRTGVMEANAHLLGGLSLGKGCVRYGRPEQLRAPGADRPGCRARAAGRVRRGHGPDLLGRTAGASRKGRAYFNRLPGTLQHQLGRS